MSSSAGGLPRFPGIASDVWRLTLILCVLFFAALGLRPLANPDEGRYAEIPREMLATGDYVTPRLDGVKYFEKPPLVYWLTASSLRVFGINEFGARFWCAALAVGGALLTYAATRALYDRLSGFFAAGVLGTSLLYYGLSRLIILDLAVAVFIAAALFAFILGMREPAGTRRRWLFWGFYAAMALAVLTKGLIGLALPCAVIFFWVLLLNRWQGLRPFYPFTGTLILLLIAAPWHILAAKANSDFLYFYFYHEHYLRFTTKIHDRTGPWWYFLPIFLAGMFPWIVFFFQSLRRTLAGGWRNRARNETAWFLLIWIVFIIAFFSKSQSKLIPYIMPVFPAAAALIGQYLSAAWMQPQEVKLTRGIVAYVIVAVLLGTALFFIPLSKDPVMRADLRPWQWTVSGVLIVGALATVWMARRRGPRAALGAMAWSTVALLVLLNPAAKHGDNRSTKPLALTLRKQLKPGDEVFSVGDYFQDLPVYLERTVSVVDSVGELSFGINSEPEKTADRFIKRDAFIKRWTGDGRCFAIAKKSDVESLLAKSDFPHFKLDEFHGLILFANRAP